ncbi:MAG TPA: FMN-binding negative transcriptional regulator [Burkholderiales bacterium]|nr:FMN-binding negative transcriptional regulator [Burkholderiales bacterium]
MIYLPEAFHETDREALHALIESHGFATLISPDPDDPVITHLPLLLDRGRGVQGTLIGHVARANPHWHRIRERPDVLAVFHGPHAYVSPSWYGVQPSVPTWNYAVVHATGRARLLHDASALESITQRLVQTFESPRPTPWRMDLPSGFRQQMLSAIVGFEIEITRLSGKFKLSQNRTLDDRRRVVAALEAGSAPESEVATLMRARVLLER